MKLASQKPTINMQYVGNSNNSIKLTDMKHSLCTQHVGNTN